MIARRLVLLLLLAPAVAEEAEEFDEAVQMKLERDGFAFGTRPLKQIFEPYIGSDRPVFITSDSILNAYHVVFEESVLRLEASRAASLGDAIAFLYRHVPLGLDDLDLDPGLRAAALKRLRIVLGTALVLLAHDPAGLPGEAVETARLVLVGEGFGMPEWLGPPDPSFRGIEWARYRPLGFYTRSPDLQRYFRAVSWLQSIPFRVERDEDLVALLLVQDLLGGFREDAGHRDVERVKHVLAGYEELLGPGDDVTVLDALGFWANRLPEMRKHYRNLCHERSKLHDQVAERPTPSVRILSASRTPDALLFQRTAELRSPPQGLDLCAALGSAWARSVVGEGVSAIVDATMPEFGGHSLHAQYLGCLAALLDEPEPDAPALFGGAPWQIKSCHTALGGWAQLRHTWSLQAKRVFFTLGMTTTEPGFVEPEPEFFARLRRLVARTSGVLDADGAFDPVHDRRQVAALLRAALADLQRQGADSGAREEPGTDAQLGYQIAQVIAERRGLRDEVGRGRDWQEGLRDVLRECVGTLEAESKPLGDLREIVEGCRFDLRLRWERLEHLCASLEALAHKQLRGVAFSDWERGLIGEYGEEIAWLMFYEGNTFSNPHDDAMRITEVFFDPRRGRRLHVGIGRPRRMWIRYPWHGKDVLCVGAVATYYEDEWTEPQTDAQFRAALDSVLPPGPPAWTKALYPTPARSPR